MKSNTLISTFFITVITSVILPLSTPEYATTSGYIAQTLTIVPGARSILILKESNDILILSTEDSRIVALVETQGENGTTTIDQYVIVNGAQWGLPTDTLNHGLEYSEGFIYASSSGTVYRWPYTPGQLETVSVPPTLVIVNIPSDGHWTRTLIFDREQNLYVAVGSEMFEQVDDDSSRSRIRRFNITRLPIGGIEFDTGEVFADGLRNEVGLAFDQHGVLWGVENSAQTLVRPDLGIDIGFRNPAEELNRLDEFGVHFGYPYCFSSDVLGGFERGTQFLWPTFLDQGIYDDTWCRNISNNKPPTLVFPAHSAPLGITFVDGRNCNNSLSGAFPCSAIGNAIVAFHGSQPYLTNPPDHTGYVVTMYEVDNDTHLPTGEEEDIIYERNKGCVGEEGCFRPVNAIFDNFGRLIVSSDETGEIVRVTYEP